MERESSTPAVRAIGVALIVYAIAFNLPYAWLGANFDYPAILRQPPGAILEAFTRGGTALIAGWACFALAALLMAPVAVAVARVTRSGGAVAALGIAAAITQAIGLSRWVYAVPGLASQWASADPAIRASIESTFLTLHQFAGVGIGEAIGQSLTAFWLIGTGLAQRNHPRFGNAIGGTAIAGGAILLLGLVEGLATVLAFDPGVFGLAALVGFLVLTVWMIWTGVLCIRLPAAE